MWMGIPVGHGGDTQAPLPPTPRRPPTEYLTVVAMTQLAARGKRPEVRRPGSKLDLPEVLRTIVACHRTRTDAPPRACLTV